jgi:hypothetical protein
MNDRQPMQDEPTSISKNSTKRSRAVTPTLNDRLEHRLALSGPGSIVTMSHFVSPQTYPINVPGGTIVRSLNLVLGNRDLYVAQVQIPGASGNQMRIYATLLNHNTGRPIRSNMLVSNDSEIGNSQIPTIGTTTKGMMVVAWGFHGYSANRVRFRMIDPAAGNFITDVIQANSPASNTHEIGIPTVRANAGGGFTVRWIDWTTVNVHGADFASNGVTIRPEYNSGPLLR